MQLYRQGDVLIREVARLPKNLKVVKSKNRRFVLAEGEATGHAHTVAVDNAKLFIDGEGRLFMTLDGETQLVHQEHDPIILAPGNFEVVRQREYSPEAIRNVAD